MDNYINFLQTPSSVDDTTPSVSFIESTDKIIYKKELRYTTDKTKALPGDIVVKIGNSIYFCNAAAYLQKAKQSTNLKTIGVVVVPSSHTTDNTVRIVSVNFMDPNRPVSGSSRKVISSLPYGDYVGSNAEIAANIKTVVPGTTTTSSSTSAQIPTTYHGVNGKINTDDSGTHYVYDGNYSYAPSPYALNGGKSTITFDGSNTATALKCMSGSTSTDSIIAQVTDTWYSGSTSNKDKISRFVIDKGCSAACCCRRYIPDSLASNDSDFGIGTWYMPSIGELSYFIARFEEIERSRLLLGGGSSLNSHLLSSTAKALSGSNYSWWVVSTNPYSDGSSLATFGRVYDKSGNTTDANESQATLAFNSI